MLAENLEGDGRMAAAILNVIKTHRDLRPSTVQVLIAVYEDPLNPKSQHQMRRAVALSRNAVVKATHQLAEKGLINYIGERLLPVNIIKYL